MRNDSVAGNNEAVLFLFSLLNWTAVEDERFLVIKGPF